MDWNGLKNNNLEETLFGSDNGPSKLPWCKTIMGTKYNSDGSYNMGEVSDGYHTFDELYEHRTVLFACICKLVLPDNVWRSDLHSDGTMYDNMFIVGINTEFGTVSYHIDNKYKGLFKFIKKLDKAPEWDGTTPEKGLEYLIKAILKVKNFKEN